LERFASPEISFLVSGKPFFLWLFALRHFRREEENCKLGICGHSKLLLASGPFKGL
jgi:hypothetical protein